MSLFYRALGIINRPAAQDEEGQAMVEYGLLVALIAVVALAAITLLGGNIADKFQQIADAIGAIA